MGAEVRAHRIDRLANPVVETEWMKVMEDKERRHEIVVRHPPAQLAVVAGEFEHAGKAASVELGDETDDILHLLPCPQVEGRLEMLEELLDPIAGGPEVDGCRALVGFAGDDDQPSTLGSIVGECSLRSTFPLPRYMCTPHGRHGSKLRTARMMSMPLKLSIEFSSKIGVFITASS